MPVIQKIIRKRKKKRENEDREKNNEFPYNPPTDVIHYFLSTLVRNA